MGSNSSTNYRNARDMIDHRDFNFGELWLVKDEFISIPDADRSGSRKCHDSRPVVIVDNNNQNCNELSPVISIAPISSRTDCIRKFDVLLDPQQDQVRTESLARMMLVQPVLKKDLHKCVGCISKEKCNEIIDIQLDRVGINIEDYIKAHIEIASE